MRHFHAVLGTTLGMGASSWERLIVAIFALGGVTYLGATGHMQSDAVVGIYAAVVGYVLGHSAGTTAEKMRHNDEVKK